MAESQMTAEAVALRQLGYSVPEHDVGVTIYVHRAGIARLPEPSQVGDVVTSVDGTPDHQPRRSASRHPRRISPGDA